MNIEQFTDLKPVGGRFDHLDFALTRRPINGEVIECGVYAGNSLRHIAGRVHHVWGFDSFDGLPEPWKISPSKIRQAGTFAIAPGAAFDVPRNAGLVQGLFAESIPLWLETYKESLNKPPTIGLLHIDCDLYQSAMDVLRAFDALIVTGSVIVFDELGNWPEGNLWYECWRDGEWKALNDWIDERARSVAVLGRDNQHAGSVIVTA